MEDLVVIFCYFGDLVFGGNIFVLNIKALQQKNQAIII